MDNEAEENRDEIFGPRLLTAEELTAQFQSEIRELGESPVELADRMHKLGDYRSYSTILRGVQRMLSGETRVSGEIRVLMTIMLRQQRRLEQKYANLSWKRLPDGSHSTQAYDFRITLVPQTRGRWLVNLVYKDGYSPPWPR